MRFLNTIVLCAALGAGGGLGLLVADDAKPAAKPAVIAAAKIVPAAKADDKKADDKKADDKKKKKLTEQEEADLEYKKYLEEQAKAREAMAKLATHAVSKEIKVSAEDKKGGTLQTLTLSADNKVLALVGPPRGYGAPTKGATAEVQVFNDEGKKLETWKIPFHGHSLSAAPDGTVYVAGDGKVAMFKDGKAVGEPMELPHITEMFKDKDALRKKAAKDLEDETKQRAESLKAAKEQFEKTIKKIEEVKEEDRTKAQTRQLQQAKSILESYAQMEKQESKRTVDDVIASMTGRVRIINGIAVGEKDVYIACGEGVGYGYAVWRFDRDLKNPKQILKGLGGCCGQMDVQVAGPDIVIAENTKHQFAKYDRDGQKIGGFGKRASAEGDPACFGGCCNPMNTRSAAGNGDIYTSESEGIVKRFSSTGAFIGVAGTVKIDGGCKNVAIGVSGDGEKIVFCDQPGSRFFILAKKSEKGESK